jgi:DNA modification methylase
MEKVSLFGVDLFGEIIKPKANGVVAQRFTIPPFTILDSKQGEWQERKRAWKSLGIDSEIGRSAGMTYGKGLGIKLDNGEESMTSIFDPVVCELAMKWFCPKKGQVVDPFAGGSVRGIVAGALDRNYWGCDLRQEQIDANRVQAENIETSIKPIWVCGDSMETLAQAPKADMVFSCPPYGDLEVYSDDPNDLSNMEWHTFIAAYKRIILRSVQKMKDDTFACFVVGDFRDKKGFYRNFVSETIGAFEEAGAKLYNEAILATSIGSASMRVTKQFESGRKMAKTHQNVLVFCKGDWRVATSKINDSELIDGR